MRSAWLPSPCFTRLATRILLIGLLLMAAALGGASALRRERVKSFWLYLLGPGVVSWLALFLGGCIPRSHWCRSFRFFRTGGVIEV